MNIVFQRLRNQCITRACRGSAADLVAALGAVQAQEYPFAKWALALRLAGRTTDGDIEAAVERGEILRTHVLRPTWHFVAAADINWMLQLTAPRVHARLAVYVGHRGLDKKTLTRATAVMEKALDGGRHLTRQELRARLARARIDLDSSQLGLVMLYAELERVVCSGPRRGRQFTYALLGERAPKARLRDRDEALAELTQRYFASHGPATIRDFVWWSSLTTADARRGLDMIRARPVEQDGLTYWSAAPPGPVPRQKRQVSLLPIYDEYLVAYRDRLVVPHLPGAFAMGLFRHALVIDGQVVGTWTTDRASELKVTPVRRLSALEKADVEREGRRFARFLGAALHVSFA